MEKLIEIITTNWLKVKSIPFSLILAVVIYVSLLFSLYGVDDISVDRKLLLLLGAAVIICEIIYILLCCWYNRIRCAPKGTLAVLFCIDAETEDLYENARFKLVENFNCSLDSSTNMKALCIPKKRISKYNLQNKYDALALLNRTNCIFIVNVRYTADSANSAENFELRINYGVRHPRFNEAATRILSHDLTALGKPMGSQRFEKSNTINVFNFTTQTLLFACQYILGVVYLLSGDGEHALGLLVNAKKATSLSYSHLPDMQDLEIEIDDRIFSALCLMGTQRLTVFQNTKSEDALHEMCKLLNMANVIRPDTYHYNLNMAYAHIILNRDAAAARECVNKCKQAPSEMSWLYSDAFLSAYTERSAGSINSKYIKAFKTPYKSLSEIVEYIELVLEREPQKASLHFAAGLVYEEMGDYMLMKQHFAHYLSESKKMDPKILALVRGKMQAVSCGRECNSDCILCSA